MMNELRLGPVGLLGFLVALTSGGVGCATGASIADLIDASGGTTAGDAGHVADGGAGSADTGGIIFIGDTGTPPATDTGTGTGTGTGDSGTMGGCSGGTVLCAGSCVDTSTNLDNCGTCGNACASGDMCSAGVCVPASTCGSGDTSCGGICTDTTSDSDNCGSCGNICPSGSCVASTCTSESGDDSGGGDDSGSGDGYPGCAHSACETGSALQNGCDDDGDEIVSAVCEQGVDPDCCKSSHSWDSECVMYAQEWCEYIGGCEFDPGCE